MTSLCKQREPELREFSPADKQAMVQTLWNAVNNGGNALFEIPKIIRAILRTKAWQDREVDGKPYHNNTFVEFITDKPLKGCGWPLGKVERLISDDPEVLQMWREATNEQGKRTDLTPPNLSHNITEVKAKRTGTGRAYTLDRLKRERKDLFDQVVAEELSANAAAIEAGFRKKPTPLGQLQAWWKKASAAERRQFRRWIKTK